MATISTLNDKGVSPTELEFFVSKLLEETYGNLLQTNNFEPKIEISLAKTKKLTKDVIDYIVKKEEQYTEGKVLYHSTRYDYYAYTLKALTKLNFVDENGKIVNQSGFASMFKLRRATLNKHMSKMSQLSESKAYIEIERNLLSII